MEESEIRYYQPPTYHDFQQQYLDKNVEYFRAVLQEFKDGRGPEWIDNNAYLRRNPSTGKLEIHFPFGRNPEMAKLMIENVLINMES